MMLVDSITFSGHKSQVRVHIEDGRAFITIDNQQIQLASIDQLRALQSALTRIIKGR